MSLHISPATRDAWSYAGNGDFYVEVSGNNHHRRAAISELKAVYDGSDGSKDRPGHWYEAQLIHYGLPPSKTKGTAKMRLFDALNKGNLAVPAHILKVEGDLKKDWNKREREAKQAAKKSAPTATTASKGSRKRNADDAQINAGSGTNVNINLSVSVGPQGNIQVTPANPAPKKLKTTKTNRDEKPEKPAKAAPKGRGTAKKAAASTPSASATAKKSDSTKKASRTTPTARRGTSSARGARTTSSRPASDEPSNVPLNLRGREAQCSWPFKRPGQGRAAAASALSPVVDTTPSRWDSSDDDDDPPPPYPGSPAHGYNASDGYGHENQNDGPLPPLGLLNGRYEVRCTGWPQLISDQGDSGIIFTLDGNALWGSFELGYLSGILRLDERPWQSSRNALRFEWRGEHVVDGYNVDSTGLIRFLGGGEISGEVEVDDMLLEFDGCRVSGQGTRSEISALSMRRQWQNRQH
ncbi:hypothetical protein MFIFM68171_06469 [Madurella fahalii]|uniref:Uncharacterized protein n=1 Tax=Madurella fahalii TaxID=1157608 RepID=A0ABQ0GF09_9PEZI